MAPPTPSRTWSKDRRGIFASTSARPRNACGRRRVSSSGAAVTEREGFELSVRCYPYTRLAGVHLRPLGHLSKPRATALAHAHMRCHTRRVRCAIALALVLSTAPTLAREWPGFTANPPVILRLEGHFASDRDAARASGPDV